MSKLTTEQVESIEQRLVNGESLRSIALDLGVTYQSLQYHRRRAGSKPLRPPRTSGENHASWRGGSFVDRWGYRMIRAPERGKANPYVPEHILVAERTANRNLERGEVVHHIDCDKQSNHPSNLLICSRSEHKRLHAALERLSGELFRMGLIRWTGSTYELTR